MKQNLQYHPRKSSQYLLNNFKKYHQDPYVLASNTDGFEKGGPDFINRDPLQDNK